MNDSLYMLAVNLFCQQIKSVRWDIRQNIALFEYVNNFIGKGMNTRQDLLEFARRNNIKDVEGTCPIKAHRGAVNRL